MSRGVNKVIAIGNLGQDPETRYVPSGAAVTNFSIGVNEAWKDKTTGEQVERTEWISVEVWGKLAELCAQYLSKGSQCYVEGKIQTDSWDDKDSGKKRYRTKVRADNVQFLGAKGDRAPARQQEGGGQPAQGRGAPKHDDYDDDIPF